MTAARAGNPAVMRLLLARSKADVNARESAYGETALMWAAAENHAEAAQLLIEHGAAINARSQLMSYPKDRFGLEGVISILPHGQWTPLMYAARQGSLGALRVLVKAGADLNLSDPDGTTALVFAIINSHYDAARLLVEAGANPNLADTAGMAALYAAVDASTLGEIYGRPGKKVVNDSSALDLMNVLLAHGANPNAQLTVGGALSRTYAGRAGARRGRDAADAGGQEWRRRDDASSAGARRRPIASSKERHHGFDARRGTRPGAGRVCR